MADVERRPGGAQFIPRPAVWSEHDDTPWDTGAHWTADELTAPVPATAGPLRTRQGHTYSTRKTLTNSAASTSVRGGVAGSRPVSLARTSHQVSS